MCVSHVLLLFSLVYTPLPSVWVLCAPLDASYWHRTDSEMLILLFMFLFYWSMEVTSLPSVVCVCVCVCVCVKVLFKTMPSRHHIHTHTSLPLDVHMQSTRRMKSHSLANQSLRFEHLCSRDC